MTRLRRPVTAALLAALIVTMIGWSAPARPAAVSAAEPTPVARWTFDDGTGSTATDSVGDLDGTLVGGTSWLTSGAAEGTGAIHFDGVDDAVTIETSPTLEPTGTFTVMFWFRSSVQDIANHTIIQKNFYGCDAGGSWSADHAWQSVMTQVLSVGQTYPSSTNSTMQIAPGNGAWHRVAMVVDAPNGTLAAWIDGYKKSNSYGVPFDIRYGATGRIDDHMRLGGPGADCPSKKPFNGDVDDLRLYDAALTDDQVRAEMPVFSTSTTVIVGQDGSPDNGNIFSDRPAYFFASFKPLPPVGDYAYYLSTNGGPETLYATQTVVEGGSTLVQVPAGTLDAGSYSIRAAWLGTPNWLASTSPAVPFTVDRHPVAMGLQATPADDVPGGGSSLKATIWAPDSPQTAIPGSIEFHEVTGGGDVLVGTVALSYVGDPDRNRAILAVSGLSSGIVHQYQARFTGSDTFTSGMASASVGIGPQHSDISLAVTPNPVLHTAAATATVDLATSRRNGITVPPLPAATGTLTLKRTANGEVLGTTVANGNGQYTITLPILPTGSVALVAEYSGDVNFEPSTSNQVTLSIQSDIVDATAVAVGYSRFYPIKDGYRDTLPITGVRNEPISVAIRIYNSSNKLVKSLSVASGTGPYSVSWTGRTSTGALRASGTYRVVQTLTDSHGIRLVVTKYATLSAKRLYYSTKTLSKLAYKASSVGTVLGGQVLRYSDGSIRIDGGGGGWAGVGWQFTLPSATVYKSIVFGVYGYSGVPPSDMVAQNFALCAKSSSWDISCFDRNKAVRSSKGWTSRSISPTSNRSGTTVRLAVSQYFGRTKVYKVRVVVTYGVLR